MLPLCMLLLRLTGCVSEKLIQAKKKKRIICMRPTVSYKSPTVPECTGVSVSKLRLCELLGDPGSGMPT